MADVPEAPQVTRGKEVLTKAAEDALRSIGIGPPPPDPIENALEVGRFLESGLPAPRLDPDFEPLNLGQYVTYDAHGNAQIDMLNAPNLYEVGQRMAPLWYNSGKIPAWDIGAPAYPPIVAEQLWQQELTDEYSAYLQELQDNGFTYDVANQGAASWASSLDILNGLMTGISPDHRTVWEANYALWEDQSALLREYRNEREAGRAMLEAHQAYNVFTDDWGGAIGQDRMDAISMLIPRELDEQRVGQLMARAWQNLSDNQDEILATDETKNNFVAWFISEAAALSQSYQLEHGLIEAEPSPGLWDVAKAIAGTGTGIADFLLPDEWVGDPFTGGSILGGATTSLGYLGGTPGIEQILGGLGRVWEPINEEFTRPFMQGVTNIFAGQGPIGSHLPFAFSDPNPFTVYMTPGQKLMTMVGADYGTNLYVNGSGAFDAGLIIVGDPIFVLAPTAKALGAAARVPFEAGVLGAKLAKGGPALTKNQLINRISVPYLGKDLLPLGFTGMKGPLTRVLYVRFAKTADELSKSAKAMQNFQKMLDIGKAGGVGALVDEFKVLENAPNLANHIVEFADTAEDVRQVWVKALTSGLAAPEQLGALEAKLAQDYHNAAAAIRGGLANGTIGALDLRGLKFGSAKWDGRYGYTLQPDGSFKRSLLKGTGENTNVFGYPGKIAGVTQLRQLAARADAPWILRNVINSIDQGAMTTYQKAKQILDDLHGDLAGHSPQRLTDAGIKEALDTVRGQIAEKRAALDKLTSKPSWSRSQANKLDNAINELMEAKREIEKVLSPEDFRGVPKGIGAGARALGERAFMDVLTEYLRGFGFDGFSLGSSVWLDDAGRYKLMQATDAQHGTAALARHFQNEAENLSNISRLTSMPDELSWIINLPISSQSATLLKGLKGRAAAAVNRWLPEETVRGLRRRGAKFTRVADSFPSRVSLHDTKVGVNQLRQIGKRIGASPEEIADWVNRYVKSGTYARFDTLTQIRAEMVGIVDHWRYKHKVDGFFIDGGEFQPGKMNNGEDIARMASSTVDGQVVGAPWLPSHRAMEMDFFRPDFYEEMERLMKARRFSKLPFGSKFVEGFGFMGLGARERRADLVARWRSMVENRAGGGVLTPFEDADIYNMAFAAHSGSLDGLGLFSKAANQMSQVNKLIHSQFSINALALRASSWTHKVAIVEEPIRLAIGGIINQFANPPGALMNMYGTLLVRKVQRDAGILVEIAPQARRAIRQRITATFDDPSLVSGQDIYRAALDDLGESLKDFLPTKKAIKDLTEQQAWNMVDSFVNRAVADADFSVNGRVTSFSDDIKRFQRNVDNIKNQRLSRLAFDEGEMTIDDILNVGFGTAAREIGHSIFQNTVFDEFTRGFDNARGYVPIQKGAAGRKQYAQAKSNDMITLANDPYFRIGVKRMLNRMHGVQGESINSIIARSQWKQVSVYARRTAEQMIEEPAKRARVLANEKNLATWYFDEFLAERAIPTKIGMFYMDEATKLPLPDAMEKTLQGILDRRLETAEGIVIPLDRGSAKLAASRLDTTLENGYNGGRTWEFAEQQALGEFNPHQGFSQGAAPGSDWGWYDHVVGLQHKANIVNRKIIEYAGARASEVITRQPGWRRVFADYKRHYENLGWDSEQAKAAAQIQATKTINTLMYNAREMNNFLREFNSVVPFGAAMYEVMNVWMRQLPKDNVAHGGLLGWTVGSVALQKKFGYTVQALEGLGLVQRDEDGNPQVVLDTKGRWASQALASVYGGPQRLLNKILGMWDINVPDYEGMTIPLGTPFQPLNPDNNGIMAVSNFSIGMSPPVAFAANMAFGAHIGASREFQFEGGTLSDLMAAMDVEPVEFFSDPRNRTTLRDMGIDPELFNDLASLDSGIQIAILAEALDVNVTIPKGTFNMPNTGALRDFAASYVFPYGAPQSLSEVVGAYTPSAVQNMLRSFEMMFSDGEAPVVDWFLGPVSAYRTDGALIEGIIVDHINRGTLDTFMNLHNQITDLRQEALDAGLAYFTEVDEPGYQDRFRWSENYGADFEKQVELEGKIEKLQQRVADEEEITLENATNIAIAQGFGKAFTQLALPTSPQTYTADQKRVQEFWATREMAEAFFPQRNPDGSWAEGTWDPQAQQAAWTRFVNLTGEGWLGYMDTLRAWLTPKGWEPGDALDGSESWGMASSSDVKKQFLAAPGNDTLHYYLTPSKVYPEGYTSAEDISDFFQKVQGGQIQFADPSVFLMRGWTSKVNWDQGSERQAFVDKYTGDFRSFVDHWSEWMDIVTAQKNQRDYLDFIDDKLNMGYNDARALANELDSKLPDAEQVIRDHVLTERRRTQATLGRLLDDLDGMTNLDPEDLSDMKQSLFQIKALTDDMVGQGNDLDTFFARTQDERDLDLWFDTVINPHARILEQLYDLANNAEVKHVQQTIFDNIRFYENEIYDTRPVIRGITAKNPYEFRLLRMLQEVEANGGNVEGTRLEQTALRQIALKVDWLSKSDTDVIDAYVGLSNPGLETSTDALYPHTDEEWSVYSLRNTARNSIEAGRIQGLYSDTEAGKMKASLDAQIDETLRELGRGAEVDFQDKVPAQQLFALGVLPTSLEGTLTWTDTFLEQAEAMRQAGVSGIDNLWRQEYWPSILQWLQDNPMAKRDLQRLGGVMYKESNDLLTITRRFFLGKFGQE